MTPSTSRVGRLTRELFVVRILGGVGEWEARLPKGTLVRGIIPGHDFFDASSHYWSFEASTDGGASWFRLRSTDEPDAVWTDD